MQKKISFLELKKKVEKDFLVLLTEEYGYRLWFWFPFINEEKLISWWQNLEDVSEYFMTPAPLEGWLVHAEDYELCKYFRSLEESKIYMTAHLHENYDSYLISSDGKTIYYHKGYEEDD